MLSVTYSALSQASNEMLAIVDTKMDGILDGTNRIVQVTGRVETDVIDIRGQVAQQQIQTQKAQDGAFL